MNFEKISVQKSEKQSLLDQINTPDFISALNAANKLTRLGGGKTAVAWKMETTLGDTPFAFARKQFQSGNINQINHESVVLTKIQSIEGVPTLLQKTNTFIDIELIKGVPLGKMTPAERKTIPRPCVVDFFHTLIKIAAHGIINSDLNVNNILYDSINQKLTLVDFGGATICEDAEPKKEQLKFVLLGLKKLFPNFQEFDNFYQLINIEHQKLTKKMNP